MNSIARYLQPHSSPMSRWRWAASATAAVLIAAGSITSSCGGGTDSDAGDGCEQLSLRELSTTTIEPAGVRVVFTARDCRDEPLEGLSTAELEVLADDVPLAELGVAPVELTQTLPHAGRVLLLIDVSSHAIDGGALDELLQSAWSIAQSALETNHSVAVQTFAGAQSVTEIVDYTFSRAEIEEVVGADGSLYEVEGGGTRDLLGAVSTALDSFGETQGGVPSQDLFILTAGPDQAMSRELDDIASMLQALENTNSFLLGLGDTEALGSLQAIAPQGFELASSPAELNTGAERLWSALAGLESGRYLLALCSPRVGGMRQLTLRATHGQASGSLTVSYDAEGFDLVGCDPADIAEACQEPDCTGTDGDADADSDGDADGDADADADADGDGDADADGDADGDGDSDADVPPLEECNGLDDDGDGEVDEDFECALGEEVECTTSCGSTGAGTCSELCELPSTEDCAPLQEVCGNGVDDDCDGYTDPPAGIIGDPLALTPDEPWTAFGPRVAWNGSEYGVVWVDYHTGTGQVYFTLMSTDGVPIGSVIQVSDSDPEDSNAVSIVWTGTEFGILWSDWPAGMYIAQFAADGTRLGSDILVADSSSSSIDVAPLVWNGTDYAVAWSSTHAEDSDYLDVYFARFETTGVRIGAITRITDSDQYSRTRDLVWADGQYGLLYYDRSDLGWELYFTRLSSVGEPSEPALSLGFSRYLWRPSLTWNGSEFGVAWHEDIASPERSLVFTRLDSEGALLGDSTEVLTSTFGYSSTSSLIWDGAGYLLVASAADSSALYVDYLVLAALTETGALSNLTSTTVENQRYPDLLWNGSEAVMTYTARPDHYEQNFFARLSLCWE